MKRVLAKMDKLQLGPNGHFLLDPKWLSLSCFILQNSLLIIGLKACVINSSHSMNSYIASTAVILSEILKFILSTIACYVIDCKCNYNVFREVIYNVIMEEGADVMKLCVPALLYTIQNNLQYVIEEAPLFVVLYQAKIITTALFYSTMLNRRMNSKEWMCILALTIGVVMVESSQMEIVPNHVANVVGVVAVVFACLTSGVAGVYFEKILKSSRSSIWVINMQMSLLSAFFCTSVALTQDSLEIVHHGVFTGYNPLVLLSIVLQALTGLAVALVVKYADNLYKGFGHSLSLVICSSVSSLLFDDTSVNEAFLLGSFLVVASSTAYTSVAQVEIPHIRRNSTNTTSNISNNTNTNTTGVNNTTSISSTILNRTYNTPGEFTFDNINNTYDTTHNTYTPYNTTYNTISETDVESALDAAEPDWGNNNTTNTNNNNTTNNNNSNNISNIHTNSTNIKSSSSNNISSIVDV